MVILDDDSKMVILDDDSKMVILLWKGAIAFDFFRDLITKPRNFPGLTSVFS
jgi:hypothetical protein